MTQGPPWVSPTALESDANIEASAKGSVVHGAIEAQAKRVGLGRFPDTAGKLVCFTASLPQRPGVILQSEEWPTRKFKPN